MTFAPVWSLVIVAALAVAQPAPKSEDLYQHVQQRVLEDVARIPRFTCVQTITRRVYATSAPNRRPPSCEEIVRDHNAGKHNPPLVSWDRLRLDVAIAERHEVFSWVGATKFEDHDLHELVGGGQTELGDFGPFLFSVFYNHPSMHFERMGTFHGQRLVEYSYRTPIESSHYDVRVGSELYTTAYDGSAFLDPTTRDLVRLTAHSAPLPAQSGFCQVTSDLEYSRLRVGATKALIPKRATSWAIDRTGIAFASMSEYSNCHEYVGEAVISFDDPTGGEPSASIANSKTVGPPVPIPAGLPFSCTITTPINSDTSAAGDPLDALLSSPITDASGKVLAPVGTRINGRLMAFIEYPASPGRRQSYEIGVQLQYIQLAGKRVPFRATLASETRKDGAWIRIPLHPTQYGTFVLNQKKVHLTNLDSKWVTAPVPMTTAAR